MTKNKDSKNNYLIKTEELDHAEKKLYFKVPGDKLNKYIEQAVNKLAKEMKVDGFRSGKVPRKIIEQKVGKQALLDEAAEEAVKEIYVNAVIDNKIEAIGQPKIKVDKVDEKKGFEFSAEVGILPKVVLGEWRDEIKKINKKYQEKKVEVKEAEIDKELEFLANQRAKVITVNRSAKKGDQLEIDFQAFQKNVALEGGTAKKHPVIIGEGKFIPGFEEKLIGAKAGEEKEFNLFFPKEYHAQHLAGKEVTFKVKINLVQERQIPKIDETFAKNIGKFKSLKELKDNIRDGLKHEKEHQQTDGHKKELMDVLVAQAKFSVPKVLIEREMDTMMAELEQDVMQMGLTKEKYLSQIKKTESDLKKQWENREALQRVQGALILRFLAEEEKLSPTAEEIEKQVNQAMQQFSAMGQQPPENLDVQRVYEATKGTLTNQKVFEWLMKL